MNKASILGLVFGFLLSFISACLFMLFAQIGASGGGSPTSLFGESWLYFATLLPFTIGFSVLGAYFRKQSKLTNKKLWLISLLFGFLLTLFSGTIGAILGETIVRGGIETVNVEDTLIWGTIYSFIFTPIVMCFLRLLFTIFISILIKFNAITLK